MFCDLYCRYLEGRLSLNPWNLTDVLKNTSRQSKPWVRSIYCWIVLFLTILLHDAANKTNRTNMEINRIYKEMNSEFISALYWNKSHGKYKSYLFCWLLCLCVLGGAMNKSGGHYAEQVHDNLKPNNKQLIDTLLVRAEVKKTHLFIGKIIYQCRNHPHCLQYSKTIAFHNCHLISLFHLLLCSFMCKIIKCLQEASLFVK